jgi:hypothetical protein
MVNNRGQIVIGLIGLSLVAAFFLPWVTLGPVFGASGLDIVRQESIPGLTRIAVLLAPIAGVVLIVAALSGRKSAANAALVIGAAILIYALIQTLRVILFTTGSGLWITVLAAMVALIVGLVARRARD